MGTAMVRHHALFSPEKTVLPHTSGVQDRFDLRQQQPDVPPGYRQPYKAYG